MMITDYAESWDLFSRSKLFTNDMQSFVDRIRLLHWAMDKLATQEFDIKDNNEWMWTFSDMCFRTIIADAQRACGMADAMNRAHGADVTHEAVVRGQMLATLEELQRAALAARRLAPKDIDARVERTARMVSSELETKATEAEKPRVVG